MFDMELWVSLVQHPWSWWMQDVLEPDSFVHRPHPYQCNLCSCHANAGPCLHSHHCYNFPVSSWTSSSAAAAKLRSFNFKLQIFCCFHQVQVFFKLQVCSWQCSLLSHEKTTDHSAGAKSKRTFFFFAWVKHQKTLQVRIDSVETEMGTSKDLRDSCICDWSCGDDLLQRSTTSGKQIHCKFTASASWISACWFEILSAFLVFCGWLPNGSMEARCDFPCWKLLVPCILHQHSGTKIFSMIVS